MISGGVTFGAGYDEAKALLQDHPGGGLNFGLWKFVASLAAACSGAPGGIFAPALATGAGIGAAFVGTGLAIAGRQAVVLGMASYLTGVVQAPFTSAVILMEMTRDPGLVGPLMLAALIAREDAALGLKAVVPQSDSEGQLLDWIHLAADAREPVILNAGGLTHTSVALRDACAELSAPLIEVHISNVHAREEFRRHSYLSPVATGVIVGLGIQGYLLALRYLAESADD